MRGAGTRWRVGCGMAALVFLGIFTPLLQAQQLTEEQKKELFLKAREDIRPVPRQEATPRPRPRPQAVPKPTPRPAPTPKPEPKPAQKPAPEPDSEPASRSHPPPSPDTPPKPEEEDIIPLEREEPAPRRQEPTPRPTPHPRPKEDRPRDPSPKPESSRSAPVAAPVVIEKSGLIEEEGFEPPPKKSIGIGWFRRYRYLTPSVRKAIDRAAVRKGRWRYIIIHNSGTRNGNARIFGNYHRNVRKMPNGLAYHFVIGNGRGSGNGEIEIGSRWTRQINGGHVASDYLNNIALGICLVGDLNRDRPTAAQLAATEELVDYLRARVGKVKGRPAAVRGHKQINPKPTDCPGDRFDLKWLRRRFGW